MVHPVSAAAANAARNLKGSSKRLAEMFARRSMPGMAIPVNKACAQCGCECNDKKGGLQNKLAMATEKCPKGKWE